MSTDYDVYCVDCDSPLGLSDWNHADAECRELVKAAPVLAQLVELSAGLAVELTHWRGNVDWQWFALHAGHTLRVRDEYGRFDDTCDAREQCPRCKSYVSCKREKGHAGDHAAVRLPASLPK